MSLLSKFALPSSNERMIEEINYCKHSYDSISNLDDFSYYKEKQKKKILSVAFESLAGLFDLDYEQKLEFNNANNLEAIYIKDLTEKQFDEAFYLMYRKAFLKYLEKMPNFINNRVDKDIYMISRMAYLNNDSNVLEKLTKETYCEIFEIKDKKLVETKISKDDVKRLLEMNIIRLNSLKNTVLNYQPGNISSIIAMKNVYNCFSSSAFCLMNKEEKLRIMELLYQCFSDGKASIYKKYTKIINDDTTNKECLKIIMKELIIPGRTMMIFKRNKDKLNDLLSGLPYIYSNEINKDKLHSLDDLLDFLPSRR